MVTMTSWLVILEYESIDIIKVNLCVCPGKPVAYMDSKLMSCLVEVKKREEKKEHVFLTDMEDFIQAGYFYLQVGLSHAP